MSYELTLKRLKNNWMPIQEIRSELAALQRERQECQNKLRSISQKIPEKYKELNKLMDQFQETMI